MMVMKMVTQGKFKDKSNVYIFKEYFSQPWNGSTALWQYAF